MADELAARIGDLADCVAANNISAAGIPSQGLERPAVFLYQCASDLRAYAREDAALSEELAMWFESALKDYAEALAETTFLEAKLDALGGGGGGAVADHDLAGHRRSGAADPPPLSAATRRMLAHELPGSWRALAEFEVKGPFLRGDCRRKVARQRRLLRHLHE
ncbi:hypothetical protein HK405_013817, partial [Cladochytrium tenue]